MSLVHVNVRTPAATRKGAAALIAFALMGLLAATAAAQPVARRICVFDPSGTVGDAYQQMREYQTAALEWGVQVELLPYTDERTASEDFNAGICDAVLLTGVRSRQYNRFSGTIEAMGALGSYDLLRQVVELLANPRAAERMVSGDYETFGVFPGGAVYLFLRDRSFTNISQLAGRRISTIDFDEAAVTMVDRVGASMVPADIGTFAGMFNNGGVDVCYAPATAFRPLELNRGLASGGGIVRFALSQMTLQIIGRRAQFPEGFGDQSRAFASGRFDSLLEVVQRSDNDVPAEFWLDIPDADRQGYENVFREVRVQLRDEGVYDGTMLTLMRRIRCQADGARAECAEELE